MSAKIAELEISITDNATGAVTKINQLSTALATLREKSKNQEGLSTVVNGIGQLKGADLSGFSRLSKAIHKALKPAQDLADAMVKINKNSSLKMSGSAARAMQSVSDMQTRITQAQEIGASDSSIESVNDYTRAVQRMGDSTREVLEKIDFKGQLNDWITEAQQKFGEASSSGKGFIGTLKQVGNEAKSVLGTLIPQGLSRIVSQFGRLMKMKILRTIISSLMRGFSEGLQNVYYWAKATGNQFASSMDTITTSMNYAKNSIGAAFSTVLNAVAPVIDRLIDWLVQGINYINMFFAALQGQSTYTRAKKVAMEYGAAATDAIGSAAGAAQDLKETLSVLSFDELNQLQELSTSSGGGGGGGGGGTPGTDYGSMFETADVTSGIKKVADYLRENFEGILTTVGAIEAGILAWKFARAFTEGMDKLAALKLKMGVALMVTGSILTFTGAYDLAKNGFSVLGLVKTVLGSGMLIAGSVLTFGAAGLMFSIPLTITLAIAGTLLGYKSKGMAELSEDPTYIRLKENLDNSIAELEKAREITVRVKSIKFEYDKKMEDIQVAQNLVNDLLKFDGVENPTTSQLQEIQNLVGAINSMNLDGLSASFDVINGKVKINKDELSLALENLKEYAKQSAMWDLLVEQQRAEISKATAEQNLTVAKNDLETQLTDYYLQVSKDLNDNKYVSRQWNPTMEVPALQWTMNPDLAKKMEEVHTAYETMKTAFETSQEAEDALAAINAQLDSLNGTLEESEQRFSAFEGFDKALHFGGRLIQAGDIGDVGTIAPASAYASTSAFMDKADTAWLDSYLSAYRSAKSGSDSLTYAMKGQSSISDKLLTLFTRNAQESYDYANAQRSANDNVIDLSKSMQSQIPIYGAMGGAARGWTKELYSMSAEDWSGMSKGITSDIATPINGMTLDSSGIYRKANTDLTGQKWGTTASTIRSSLQTPINQTTANAKTINSNITSAIKSFSFASASDSAKTGMQGTINQTTANAKTIKSNISGAVKKESFKDIGTDISKSIGDGISISGGDFKALKASMTQAVKDNKFSEIGKLLGTYIKDGIKAEVGKLTFTTTATAGSTSKKIAGTISTELYASGGFPQAGTLFFAGEAGAEAVGTINGRTGVANRDQIADAIAQALRPMLNGDTGTQETTVYVNMDSTSVAKAAYRGQKNLNKQYNMKVQA